MSAPAANSTNSFRSGVWPGSSAHVRLLALFSAKATLAPATSGGCARPAFPPGASTFSTSAPRSANRLVIAASPAHRSSTRSSDSSTPGRLMLSPVRPGYHYLTCCSPTTTTMVSMSTDTSTNSPMAPRLSDDELALTDAYWRAANYLSVGQIYLLDNPLLRDQLVAEHVKPRLLGHWGTTPGLNLVYAHLNRIIRNRDADVIYITGPGHGGPGLVANAYLEGTYSEVYSAIDEDVDGIRKLFRQFSFPGGIQ